MIVEETLGPDIEEMLRAELSGKSVLLLEDDLEYYGRMVQSLYRFGVVSVQHAMRGEIAAKAGMENHFDILLFDRDNPGIDGLEALRQVRKGGTGSHLSPAILITGSRNEARDRSIGLLTGADDYVDKAVGEVEIMARIVNCLSRAKYHLAAAGAVPEAHAPELHNGPLVVNRTERCAYFFGELLDLKAQGYDLLLAFCEAPGKPFTKEMLFEIASPHWKGSGLQLNYENIVFRAIHRLRGVLEDGEKRLPAQLQPVIGTARNQGYFLRDMRAHTA